MIIWLNFIFNILIYSVLDGYNGTIFAYGQVILIIIKDYYNIMNITIKLLIILLMI